ncbi:MAG: sulfotransferase domain-containing protein, partial [Pseudomonadota bacterium]
AKTPVPINQVHKFGIGDSIAKMYHMVARREIDVHDVQLTLNLRPKVMRGIVANNADLNFVKTHNIRTVVRGTELIPANVTRQAIYIIRNPLDVILSYARHYGQTPAESVTALAHPDNVNAAEPSTVMQFLGTWSDHVKSWEKGTAFPTLVVRYEDMLEKPTETFGNVLKTIGLDPDPEKLDRAIRFSSFEEVSNQEEVDGFKERSPNSDRFFSKGTAGQWKSELDPELVAQVRRDHKRVMKKYGYYSV